MIENKRTLIGLRDTAKGHKESSGTQVQGHDLFGKDAGGHDQKLEDTKRMSAAEKGHKKDTGHNPRPRPSPSPIFTIILPFFQISVNIGWKYKKYYYWNN